MTIKRAIATITVALVAATAAPALAAWQAAPRPPAPPNLRIDFDVPVPMRDGVTLAADVYLPPADGRYPVLLTRTPYNKNGDGILRAARYFTSQGYVYVAMDVRGRGDSGGEWRPYFFEGVDGHDAIEWCAQQAWSTGKVGTIGSSYTGYNQWVAAVQQPPHLAAMFVSAPMTDPFGDVWISGPGGLPTPTMISWYHLTAGKVEQNMGALDWEHLNWHLPLLTMDEAAGRPNARWRDIVTHSKLDDWWAALRYQNQYEKVRVPVLHISGWYDDTQRATPMNFIGMRTRGATEAARKSQRLVIGPWPHAINSSSRLGKVEFGPGAIIDLQDLQKRWFDRWLKDTPNGISEEPPVRVFVMQTEGWRDFPDWPIPGTRFTRYYLHSGGRANSLTGDGSLSLTPPQQEPADRYQYDPTNPTLFLTEPSFAQLGGPDDNRPVERRSDVLVYTSQPFTARTLVCGPLRAHLSAASSARDTDFMVKVLDVWPTGFAQRLNDGMIRARFRNGMERPELIEAGRVYEYDIDAWNTCQAFLAGHRVRVEIASAAFPKFDRNPNTGDELGMNARLETARQAIYHDREHASYVELPIVPR